MITKIISGAVAVVLMLIPLYGYLTWVKVYNQYPEASADAKGDLWLQHLPGIFKDVKTFNYTFMQIGINFSSGTSRNRIIC